MVLGYYDNSMLVDIFWTLLLIALLIVYLIRRGNRINDKKNPKEDVYGRCPLCKAKLIDITDIHSKNRTYMCPYCLPSDKGK